MASHQVLVICGPAGVGKSSTAYEVAHQLTQADVSHALLDTDELDRVHPSPDGADLARRNLSALWSNYMALGHTRLILTGVFTDIDRELAWITEALPDAKITTIRLTADGQTLKDRVYRREIGSGAEAQLERTMTQVKTITANGSENTIVINTTGVPVTAVARNILNLWPVGGTR
ncbi:hypothetical protein AB0F88_06880 [Streptosporangium sp. NPDC023963]|uniref:AAA family ATPase n=1 Tax=Streptosporangium sp. NPDC023963 TaxID=3155608 RepID=UPI00343A2C78